MAANSDPPCGDAVPPAPLFARGASAAHTARGDRPRRRRHHHFTARNVLDLREMAAPDLSPEMSPDMSREMSPELSSAAPVSSGCEPPTRILDFLFLGGVRDATNAEFLRRENIQMILNISREEYWSVDQRIVVHSFVVDDTADADIRQFFRPTFHHIESTRRAYYAASNTSNHSDHSDNSPHSHNSPSSGPRVLVHCQRGRSRSATVVLAYLIRRNGWAVAEALQYVTHRRPCVEPNIGFIDALRAFQESMDTVERSRLCSGLCLAVRNIASGTATSAVHKLFEEKVGCVKEVRMRVRGAPSGGTAEESAGTERETATGEGGEVQSIFLIFFAEVESVRASQRLFMKHPEVFEELGVLPGKALKLTTPHKLIRAAKAN